MVEKKSLAPLDARNKLYAQRLADLPEFSWRENLIARLWEKENRLERFTGPPIMYMLVHECSDECAKVVPAFAGPPHALEPPPRTSVRHINDAMQWLGTSVGFAFISGYVDLVRRLEKLSLEERTAELERLTI